MARPLRIEYAGALYHITARGNARQPVYHDEKDRNTFLEILARTCRRHVWWCHAYCLMTNHYHLLVETNNPTLSRGMKYLNGTYTQYFNKTHGRVGHLFQGRFKGILVERESYLLELSRYIVLNPVRASVVSNAKDWPWSSYQATAGIAQPHKCLTMDWILGAFGTERYKAQRSYRAFIADGKGQSSPWEALKNQIYLGSDRFVEEMQARIEPEQSLEDIPRPQKQGPPKPLDYFSSKFHHRNKAMAEAYRSGHYTLSQIGRHFGVSYGTVSRAVKEHNV